MRFEHDLEYSQEKTLFARDNEGEICFSKSSFHFEGCIEASENMAGDCIDVDITLICKVIPPEESQIMAIKLSPQEARSLGRAFILLADAMEDA